MFILRHQSNLQKATPGVVLPGDVVINHDRQRSYIIHTDGSRRRLSPSQHNEVLLRVREEQDAELRRRAIREAMGKMVTDALAR